MLKLLMLCLLIDGCFSATPERRYPLRPLKRPTPGCPLPLTLPSVVTTRDARSDVTFKILFGEGGEHRTINFINAVLNPKKIQDRVSGIVILDSTLNSMQGRTVHFDVRLECLCETNGGKRFILEMQRAREAGHTNRWLYYSARELCRIGERNNDMVKKEENAKERYRMEESYYQDLDCVKVICILDFDSKTLENKLGNERDILVHWNVCEQTTHKIVSELQSWTFVVLPRFIKQLHSMGKPLDFNGSDLDAWLYLLTRGDCELVEVTDKLISGTNEIADAYHRLSSLTEREKNLLEMQKEEERSAASAIRGAREEVQEEVSRAIDMVLEQVNTDEICAETGLSNLKEFVEGLRKKNQQERC